MKEQYNYTALLDLDFDRPNSIPRVLILNGNGRFHFLYALCWHVPQAVSQCITDKGFAVSLSEDHNVIPVGGI